MSSGSRSRACILLAASAITLQPMLGQRGGTGSSAPPASGGATNANGGTVPGTGQSPGRTSPTNPNQTPTTTPGVTRPIFLSGQVMLDDGTPPPARVAIQRVCSTSPHIEGYTDARGYFNIQIGSNFADALQDASTGGPAGLGDPFSTQNSTHPAATSPERLLMGCELRAQLAGYQSQAVNLTNHRYMDNPDVGTILLHRIGASEGTTVSATTLAAPKDARKAYEKALTLAKNNKLDESRKELEKAVAAYPRYALAWCELGKLEAGQGRVEDARKSFDQAVQADPKYVVPYVEISRLQLQAHQWQDLAETTQKAIKLDPFTYAEAFFWNAVANYNLRHIDAAEESARRARKLDTRHEIPQVSHLLGVILADRRDYSGAAEQMREYLKLVPGAEDAATVRSQLDQIEELAKAAPGAPQ